MFRLDYIDSLRAIACLMVIFCHLDLLGPWHFSIGLAGHVFSFSSDKWGIGYVGVNLFLVLSGFCLYWPFVRPGRKSEPGLVEFAKRRARRILPPYYIACAFAALFAFILYLAKAAFLLDWFHIHEANPIFLLKWLGVHAALLQTTVPGYFDKILGQVWSIALEASCYLFFPLLVEAFKRFNPRLVLLTLALLNALYRWKIVHAFDPEGLNAEIGPTVFALTNNLFGRCFEFAMGMFAALCVSKWIATGRFPLRIYDLLAIVPALWKVQMPIFDPHNAPRLGATIDIAWGILFGTLVIISSQSFSLRRLLAFPLLIWAGEISYSVYLVHAHVLLLLIYVLSYLKCPSGVLPVAEILIVIPLCFVVGYAFFYFFEKPYLSRSSPPIIADRSMAAVSKRPVVTGPVPP